MATRVVEFVHRHEIDPQRALLLIMSEGEKDRSAGFVYKRGKHPADVDGLTLRSRGAKAPEVALTRGFELAFEEGNPLIQLYPRTTIWSFDWGWPSVPALLRYSGLRPIKRKWQPDPDAPLPRLHAAFAMDQRIVFVVWASGSMTHIDVAPALRSKRIFRNVLEDDDLFRTLKVNEDRNALRWDDGAELTAIWLERLRHDRSDED